MSSIENIYSMVCKTKCRICVGFATLQTILPQTAGSCVKDTQPMNGKGKKERERKSTHTPNVSIEGQSKRKENGISETIFDTL